MELTTIVKLWQFLSMAAVVLSIIACIIMYVKSRRKKKDKKLRTKIHFGPNGEYAFQICRSCERYQTHPDARTETARMVQRCEECL